jgi:alkylated DNA repair dioxygenase AlkB
VRLPPTRPLFQHWRDLLRSAGTAPADPEEEAVVNSAEADGALQPAVTSSPPEPLPRDAMGVERVLRRLRWVALGYQYDWSSLSYDWKQQPQPLPPCITHFADDTVALLRQPPVGVQCGTYRPQAAVVNFYQIGDSLTSHVDRSEPAAAAPLVPLMLLLFL